MIVTGSYGKHNTMVTRQTGESFIPAGTDSKATAQNGEALNRNVSTRIVQQLGEQATNTERPE